MPKKDGILSFGDLVNRCSLDHMVSVANSFVNSAVTFTKGTIQEVEHITSAAVHAVEQPVSGLVGEGKKVAQSLWDLLTFGGTVVHMIMGTAVGYVSWELVRYIAPDWSAEVSDIITAPFRKRQRLS